MSAEEFSLWNWQRIFLGEVPLSFFVEVVIRITFIYLLLIFSMRLMGKRLATQLTVLELSGLVSLAAAVGVAVHEPSRGLLPPVIIAAIVILIGHLVAGLSFGHQWFEKISHDKIDILVSNHYMHLDAMKKTRITHERLLSQLRMEGIKHLGEVKRFYMEADGSFSLVKETVSKAGLSVIPLWDTDFLNEMKHREDIQVCKICGHKKEQNDHCPNCGSDNWTAAVE